MKKHSIESESSFREFQRQQDAAYKRMIGRCRQMILDGYDFDNVRERFGECNLRTALDHMTSEERRTAYKKRSVYGLSQQTSVKAMPAYAWNGWV